MEIRRITKALLVILFSFAAVPEYSDYIELPQELSQNVQNEEVYTAIQIILEKDMETLIAEMLSEAKLESADSKSIVRNTVRKVTAANNLRYINSTIKNYILPDLQYQVFTYMPVRRITDESSSQYRLKSYYIPDGKGYARLGDYYAIALGTYFEPIVGSIYELTFADGSIIQAVLGDVKSDEHTDSTHKYADGLRKFNGVYGNVIEFLMIDEIEQYAEMLLQERVRVIQQTITADFAYECISIKKTGIIEDF
jgi:hypothetical protein